MWNHSLRSLTRLASLLPHTGGALKTSSANSAQVSTGHRTGTYNTSSGDLGKTTFDNLLQKLSQKLKHQDTFISPVERLAVTLSLFSA
ncbi:Mitochondrial respiratory chain complexes assembly protein [Operophtera brumata]|uniref:Mitochondrial respiratory chain complexes assembly protein n=1 Tax=Operophtera brumata TaxID=104452 RepID=A0A0L7KU99_OPEBR|nr:Mitochondrial respiratory chain complexes assembly protein [Operophtera brumata]